MIQIAVVLDIVNMSSCFVVQIDLEVGIMNVSICFVVQIAVAENETAKSLLENTKMRSRIDHLEKNKAALAGEMAAKDQMVAKIQSEISKNNSLIKRKTDQMEHLNAKIDKMLLAAGGVELSPMELQINSLQKSIESESTTIAQLQQSWLRDQNILVCLVWCY